MNNLLQLEQSSPDISNLCQLDGNISFESIIVGQPIPVQISERLDAPNPELRLPPVRKMLFRHSLISQSMALPSIMNLIVFSCLSTIFSIVTN